MSETKISTLAMRLESFWCFVVKLVNVLGGGRLFPKSPFGPRPSAQSQVTGGGAGAPGAVGQP